MKTVATPSAKLHSFAALHLGVFALISYFFIAGRGFDELCRTSSVV